MQLILSEELNKQDWDASVHRVGGTVFSLSAYLDATADHWAVLYDDDLGGGLVCPYAVKLGVRILYAPFFHRYSEWIGTKAPSLDKLTAELKRHFPVADAQLKWETGLSLDTRTHQVLGVGELFPNQQVKRMLKKAIIYEVVPGRRTPELMELLHRELTPRIASIDDHSLQLLERLVARFDDRQLLQLNLLEDGVWKGAIWLLPFNGTLLYLKGTVEASARSTGGMYRLMESAIRYAIAHDLRFDFGGSNVEGVRRFNLNWGAKDRSYLHLQWNNAPLWWKMLKSLRQTWNNRSSS